MSIISGIYCGAKKCADFYASTFNNTTINGKAIAVLSGVNPSNFCISECMLKVADAAVIYKLNNSNVNKWAIQVISVGLATASLGFAIPAQVQRIILLAVGFFLVYQDWEMNQWKELAQQENNDLKRRGAEIGKEADLFRQSNAKLTQQLSQVEKGAEALRGVGAELEIIKTQLQEANAQLVALEAARAQQTIREQDMRVVFERQSQELIERAQHERELNAQAERLQAQNARAAALIKTIGEQQRISDETITRLQEKFEFLKRNLVDLAARNQAPSDNHSK